MYIWNLFEKGKHLHYKTNHTFLLNDLRKYVFLDCGTFNVTDAKHNAFARITTNRTYYSDTGSLNCNAGYSLDATKSNTSVDIKCTESETWSVTDMTCIKKGTNLKSNCAQLDILGLIHWHVNSYNLLIYLKILQRTLLSKMYNNNSTYAQTSVMFKIVKQSSILLVLLIRFI